MVSERALGLKKSAILSFAKLVREHAGKDVVRLDIGDTDLHTPHVIQEATISAIKAGRTHYEGVSRGLPELRNAICRSYKQKYGLNYSPDNVLVCPGGVSALYVTMFALCDEDDEVIITDPAWEIYETQLLAHGINPVKIALCEENDWKPDVDELSRVISGRTKAMILNSPNNPTGGILERKDLENIVSCVKYNDLFIISDEVYDTIIYDGKHTPLAEFEEARDRTITINSFSKSHAMTGWRVGYALGPREVIDQMEKLARNIWTCIPPFIQLGASVAHESPKAMLEEYTKRREIVMQSLMDMNIPCSVPKGGFYAFPDISQFCQSSEEFALYLLNQHGVAVIPGSCFGSRGEGHIRISFASSSSNDLKKGMERIGEGIARYQPQITNH